MDGARPSRFPHLSWLGYAFECRADAGPCSWNLNGRAHALHMVFRGRHPVRWISRGKETHYSVRPGSFHYLPADDESHTIIAQPGEAIGSFTLFVPRRHVADIAGSEQVRPGFEPHRLLVHDDPVLRDCMLRLATRRPAEGGGSADEGGGREEAARLLVLRLIEAGGGGRPDWHADNGTFAPRTLERLVGHIDAHLSLAPSLEDMARLAGLSPSHFARKFRLSTGLSLSRFVNRRRILRSLDLLRNQPDSLASVALDLGFSSQSHFTRLFSGLTCMTPMKYRQQFRRTTG